MSTPPLPLLLYVEPTWMPSPRKVCLYLAEKKLPETVVKVVPHVTDKEVSKVYPKIIGKAASQYMGPTVPKLAIAKKEHQSVNQEDYHWLIESSAIIEYLEDLCDAHPSLAPVGSLRYSHDLVRKCHVMAELVRAEAVWIMAGPALVLGSQSYNNLTHSAKVDIPSARAMVKLTDRIVMEKLNEQLGQIVDFEGIAGNKVGAATTADIILFGSLYWFKHCHGMDMAKGYSNIERFMNSWDNRDTRYSGLEDGKYPETLDIFRDGFKEEVWPKY